MGGIAIHVQYESRDRCVDQRGIERSRQSPRDLQSALIPCDVSHQVGRSQAQAMQGRRYPVRGMITDEHEGPAAVGYCPRRQARDRARKVVQPRAGILLRRRECLRPSFDLSPDRSCWCENPLRSASAACGVTLSRAARNGGANAVLQAYHAGLVPPACISAVKSFPDGILIRGLKWLPSSTSN